MCRGVKTAILINRNKEKLIRVTDIGKNDAIRNYEDETIDEELEMYIENDCLNI